MRITVLGVSGMLGSVMFRLLSKQPDLTVSGTSRSNDVARFFRGTLADRVVPGVNAMDVDTLVTALQDLRPDVVINCVGIIKQLTTATDPLQAIPINSILPHRLARLCNLLGARLIHISTDCVFSGRAGRYRENDLPDAEDLYGRSKLLGEVDYPHAITLRTSIIGRELTTRNGLVEWFLHAGRQVHGYTKAIFSGVTTDELTRVIASHVLPRSGLRGVYHVSSEPISKYELITLLKTAYELDIRITPDDSVVIDRSLDLSRFSDVTGYRSPSWPEMIQNMHRLEAQLR